MHTKNYVVIIRDEIMINAKIQVNLENLLSERSQSCKDTYEPIYINCPGLANP